MSKELTAISQYDINYLSFLDYVDIMRVCRSDKEINTICKNNAIFRNILYRKHPTISITPNLNITETLRKFYLNVDKLVFKNFDLKTLPRYVDQDMFRKDTTRLIVSLFIDELVNYITSALNNSIGSLILEPGEIYMNKFDIGIPFFANGVNSLDDEETSTWGVNNYIILSQDMIDYITPTIKNPMNRTESYYGDYHKIHKLLTILFFN